MNSRKYLFTEEFLTLLRGELGRKAPRGGIAQLPDMGIFDICGMADWSEEEVEQLAKRLRKHWRDLSQK